MVIGAGLAGLTAAWALTRAGIGVDVYESGPAAGGRCGPTGTASTPDGSTFVLEHGLHGVWRQYRNLRGVLSALGRGGDLVPVDDQGVILPGDPPELLDLGRRVQETRLPDPLGLLAMYSHPRLLRRLGRSALRQLPRSVRRGLELLSFDPSQDLAQADRETVASFLEDWPPPLRQLLAATTHSAFFAEPREVSLAALFLGLQLYAALDRRDSTFHTLREGCVGSLIQPLVAALTAAGGRLHLGRRVTGLRLNPRPSVRWHDGGPEEADGVIIAVDPIAFQNLDLDPALQARLAAAEIPRGVGSVVVRLWFDRSPGRGPPAGVAAGLPVSNYFWLDQLQEDYRRWAAARGGAVLECHLYGDTARSAVNTDPAALIQTVTTLAEATWPALRGGRVHGHVQQNAPIHPIFSPGILSGAPKVDTNLARVALCGDWIQSPTPVLYMERACTTGLEAARHLTHHLGGEITRIPKLLPPFPPRPWVPWVQRGVRGPRR